jgi:hypothetical protein
MSTAASEHGCATCKFRSYAERKPNTWLARLWRWHTRWCPGWRAYQRALAEEEARAGEHVSEAGNSR